jgi:hypothetical protein
VHLGLNAGLSLLEQQHILVEDFHVQAHVAPDVLECVQGVEVPDFFAGLLVQTPHDHARAHVWVLHHHLLNEKHYFWLQEAPVVNFKLVVMNELKFVEAFVQPDLVVPSKPYVDGALARPGNAVLDLVKWPVEKPGLVSHIAAKTKEDEFVVAVLLLVDHEHQTIRVAQLTVAVHSIENGRECLRKGTVVVGEPGVLGTLLLLWCQEHIVELWVVEVHPCVLLGLWRGGLLRKTLDYGVCVFVGKFVVNWLEHIQKMVCNALFC